MAPKERSLKVPQSFSRVLILAYLLCAGHPSSAVEIPKECLDADIILGLVGYGSVKALAQTFQCITMIFEVNILRDRVTAKQFQRLYDTIKLLKKFAEAVLPNDPNQSYVFEAFALSLYLATQAFDLYWRELPERLENTEEYRRELDILYDNEIVPVLEDIDDLLQNYQEYKIEKTTKHLLEMLKEISNKLFSFAQKLKAEKLKVIENEGKATVVGAALGAVSVGAAVIAFAFPPAGALMAFGYGGTILVSTAATVVSYKTRSDLIELEKQLAKLQDKTCKCRDQIGNGEKKVNKILMKWYRTKRSQSNRG